MDNYSEWLSNYTYTHLYGMLHVLQFLRSEILRIPGGIFNPCLPLVRPRSLFYMYPTQHALVLVSYLVPQVTSLQVHEETLNEKKMSMPS